VARFVVADDHALFVHALTAALVAEGLEVVGVATRGEDVVDLVAETRPDAVLLDLGMPGLDGYACLEQLREQHPDVPVVVVSGADAPGAAIRALELGAAAFVGKTVSAPELGHALRIMLGKQPVYYALPSAAGEALLPRAPAAGVVGAASRELTHRELEILQLVADGLSNPRIARKLWVTEQTVKFHVSNILKKLGATNRTEAAFRAKQLGLLRDLEESSHAYDDVRAAPN
jgi:DNA-binding NarL/FixJ family response regulator